MSKTALSGCAFAALMSLALAAASPAAASGYSAAATGGGGGSGPATTPVPYTPGQFYPFGGTFGGTVALSANRLFCNPGTVRLSVQPAGVGTKITTPASGGLLAMGLYSDQVIGGTGNAKHRPYQLLANTGSISTANTTVAATPTAGQATFSPALSQPLVPGAIYWKCLQADNATVAVIANAAANVMSTIGDNTMVNAPVSASSGITAVYGSNGFGTWPADLTSQSWTEMTSAAPDFYLQGP